jgi:outer membrane protein OmpA-like peptidoglycan-associated protein
MLSLLAGADRLGGFTEFALSDPAVVTYGVEPGAEVSVRLANYDFGTRRYEWELRLDADERLVESGAILLAPGSAAELALPMPEVDSVSGSTVWVSFHVLGLPQQLRWKLRTSPPAPQPSPSTTLTPTAPLPGSEPIDGLDGSLSDADGAQLDVDVEGDATTEGLDSGLDGGLDESTDERRDENLVGGVDESLAGGGDARLDGRTLAPGPVRDAHDNRTALPKTPSFATVPRRIDSLDPLRPPPLYVEQFVSFTVFFAPHSSKLDQTALADAAAFVAPAFAGRNVRVFCDGYTQYGSGHGADVRLSTRRAENICAAIAALGLEAEFTPVGHGQADFQGDAARFVAVRLEFEVRPTPGAASLVPAHG